MKIVLMSAGVGAHDVTGFDEDDAFLRKPFAPQLFDRSGVARHVSRNIV
jgi:hypothetical protein